MSSPLQERSSHFNLETTLAKSEAKCVLAEIIAFPGVSHDLPCEAQAWPIRTMINLTRFNPGLQNPFQITSCLLATPESSFSVLETDSEESVACRR